MKILIVSVFCFGCFYVVRSQRELGLMSMNLGYRLDCFTVPLMYLFQKEQKRFVSKLGHAYTIKNTEEQAFMLYSYGWGKVAIYSITGYHNEDSNTLRALHIEGGCSLDGNVKEGKLDKNEKNYFWAFYDDGSIGSYCNPDWILYVDHYGNQTVKRRQDIPDNLRSFERKKVFGYS